MFPLTINALERIQARFAFFCFKSREVSLEIHFITPCYLSIVLYLMKAVIFDIFSSIHLTSKCYMTSFLTILILRNTWIYISFLNCRDVTFYIEVSVDKVFYLWTILKIPDINLDYRHIRFERYFDSTKSGHKDDIVKNILNDI